MSRVYLAEDLKRERNVAIKVYALGGETLWAARIVGQLGDCHRAVRWLEQSHREGSNPWDHYREFEGIADCEELQRFMAPR